ncbi:MAG TPA: RIP metalloprotease RseP [Anaerolineae bacterium]|nr:RIP metalloprotease RseP [Anaerolineae bacterium]
MQGLPIWESIPLMLLMLGLLVIVHELGHFLAAKRFGIEAPEFGIGFPPRLFSFWKTNGSVTIQGQKILIPKQFNLPEGLHAGSWVTYKTETRNGKKFLTGISPVDDASHGLTMASQIQELDRGTEFTLNSIPLGGFVRMNEDDRSTAPNAFVSKPAWQRFIVLIAGVTMNFVLAVIIFAFLAYWIPPTTFAATTTILAIGAGTPASEAGLRANDMIVSVDGVNVRGNRDALLRELSAKCNTTVQLGIERLAPRVGVENLTVSLTPRPYGDIPCAVGVSIYSAVGVLVAHLAPNSLAAQAGIQEGDYLVKIGDFQTITDPRAYLYRGETERALTQYMQDTFKVKTTVPVQVIRDGQLVTLKMTIPGSLSPEQSNLGLVFDLNPIEAVTQSSSQLAAAIATLPNVIRGMFENLGRGRNPGVVSIVGMTQIVAEGTPSGGLPFILTFLGVLSLNLAIFNLLPIPGLDGGRLLFVIAEMVTRGHKLDPRKEGYIHIAGFVFLLMFMFVILYFDVTRILAGKSPFGP